ncbi:S-adenosylmethionine decarboxylase proenzyme isoform X2 [Nilaparvata lugens]|uniref:S-adenosylmethionine decarboxylase proenzyme isoform X2 n=1 Tax=Nilaparvata lugens TaxID=108931 RepID=UPI00193CC307|nr:S-adenosylmethionine decarboxylase proenzyme isoform X2 [Nilaparvata lugens]
MMAETEMNINSQFFEGVEKLLEIWFTRADGNLKQCDLRKIPRQQWENMLKIVHCEIISFVSNDRVDAYVLSESSMFVSRRRFILKTCGTTTPLQCLEPLLMLVKQYAGFNEVEDVFYSRKNFKRPDLQKHPYCSFEEEVSFLDNFFDDGEGYIMGDCTSNDCWYLYTLTPPNNKLSCRQLSNNAASSDPDQTLEVLMTDLDPKVMSIFTRLESSSAAEATKNSGIAKIIPNMVIDDYLFEPCGYSMNGISKNGYYMTIHITPEPEYSYVSFETNVPQASYKDIVSRVIDTFKPGNVVVTIFANKASQTQPGGATAHARGLEKWLGSSGELHRQEVKCCQLKNYDLSFAVYTKFPS